MEVLIGIEAVHAIIDEMAEPLQHIVAQALEEQARQFADRGQDAGDGDIAESREGDAVRIKYMENAHNAEVEKLQAPKKTESNSLTTALAALKVPFRAIAAKETEWEVPNGNSFVQAITNQLKGTGPYEKFGRPQIIVLGQVNAYEDKKEESRKVLETLQSWRTLR